MNSKGTLRYDIQTGSTRTHIRGTIQTDDGATHPFEGWLELLGTLESLVRGSRRDGNGLTPDAPRLSRQA
ncbi:MAG TPA: hypothetical protein VG929_04585 [Actinomycetota bacterium]|nr:hypothetical protein [Actinomycetota bacterium]